MSASRGRQGGVVQNIDVTIAKLRLLLADVLAKEQDLTALHHQFRDQLKKAVDYSVYGDASVAGTLGLMSEIQQRIASTETALRDLALVRTRAERELESLQLTKRIEAAKSELRDLLAHQVELERKGALGAAVQDLDEQIHQLRQQINEASEQAAKTIDQR